MKKLSVGELKRKQWREQKQKRANQRAAFRDFMKRHGVAAHHQWNRSYPTKAAIDYDSPDNMEIR